MSALPDDKFDDIISHKDCMFSNNHKTAKNHYSWTYDRTCYGSILIPSTKDVVAAWTISIDLLEHMTGNVAIGIDSIQQPKTWFYRNKKSPNYAYECSGKIYQSGTTYHSSTGDSYRKGDQITMRLDTTIGTLQFYKNDTLLTNTNISLQKSISVETNSWTQYRLAVALKDAQISIVEFEMGPKDKIMMNVSCMEDIDTMQTELRKNKHKLKRLQNERGNKLEVATEKKEEATKDWAMDVKILLYNNSERFKALYNDETLRRVYKNNPMELVDEKSDLHKDIDKNQKLVKNMIECLTLFDKYIENTKASINRMISPNINKYESWDIDQMIIWIARIEEGRFAKYLDVLKNGFIESEITKGEYLPDLDIAVLTLDPFNITSFPDKRDLIQHFKQLTSDKEVEGVTLYH